jgi:hypothetical protein
MAGPSGSKKRPRRGGGRETLKERRKAGDERTAWRKVRQLRAARTRLGREGRRRKISRRRSFPRSITVVGAGGSGGGGDCWDAMAMAV